MEACWTLVWGCGLDFEPFLQLVFVAAWLAQSFLSSQLEVAKAL